LILRFLRTNPKASYSGREICRKAGSKQQWHENSRWALPFLSGLMSKRLIVTDAGGNYRVVMPKQLE
jgi:hypothetical protein